MSAAEATTKATPEDREANGRFARGNAEGPGNPYARLVESTPVEPVLEAVRELSPARGDKFKDQLLANILAQNAKDAADAARATDSKRSKRTKSESVSADAAAALAETETIRPVNPPERRAANDRS